MHVQRKWLGATPRLAMALAWVLVWTLAAPAWSAPTLTPAQQESADKLKAKGGAVVPVSADSDGLSVDLGIAGKAMGDADLALVKTLPKVTELDLHGSGVTDAGLANLEGMTSLVRLHLEKTAVTDAGLAHLKGLVNLQYLNLYDTPVTDAGLAQLHDLKQLKKLYLWQTKVTSAGADAMKSAIPGLVVNRGEELAVVPAPLPANASPPAPKNVPPASAPKAGPGDLKPDNEGFIRDWLVLAPLPLDAPNAAEAVDHDQIHDEGALKPRAGEKVKVGGKELAWKEVKAGDYFLDFNAIAGGQSDNSVAYAVVYIQADAARKDLQLFFGSDDEAKVYLNGKALAKSTVGRGLAQDQDKAEGLTLDAGTNVLVFKVINEGGGWQGCLRFKDAGGKPITDLKLKLAP